VATTARPARDVQTGGFGDPNGVKGEGKPGTRATIARVGSFDLPSGGGQGNGSGGTRGVRGTVASVGFGNGVAVGNTSQPATRTVQPGGFGDVRPVEAPRAQRVLPAAANTTPVQILSKPNPVYTEEARKLRLEGEVLLQVELGANGECRVLQVLRGLGHGLDEAAMRAARQIRFRPAMENGRPVTSVTVLHVLFQMAY
jgi:TonB family protein